MSNSILDEIKYNQEKALEANLLFNGCDYVIYDNENQVPDRVCTLYGFICLGSEVKIYDYPSIITYSRAVNMLLAFSEGKNAACCMLVLDENTAYKVGINEEDFLAYRRRKELSLRKRMVGETMDDVIATPRKRRGRRINAG